MEDYNAQLLKEIIFSMENFLSGFSRLNSGAMKQTYGYISVSLIDGYA
jgi:hypothetical protein